MTPESTRHCPRCAAEIPEGTPDGLCPRCVLASAASLGEPVPLSSGRWALPTLDEVRDAFPDYELSERLGSGGMGVVFKARQRKLDRWVALKVLPRESAADPTFVERFHREARFLARLAHPNIVTVYDFGQAGPYCFLTMEFVDGLNLRQILRAGRLSAAEALAVVPGICAALQYAHEQGVLHRDIKPENILVDSQGRVKLVDFGVAKLVGDPGATSDITLTVSGATLGTPQYMAPEQIEKPSDVDHRADIYSLGVVFYEMLTGELPLGRFAAPSAKASLDAHLEERVDAIVLRALAKERELRQQSAGEVKAEVETVSQASAPSRAAAPPSPRTDSASATSRPTRPGVWAVVSTLLLAVCGTVVGLTLWGQPFFSNQLRAISQPASFRDLGTWIAMLGYGFCLTMGPWLAMSWARFCEARLASPFASGPGPALPRWAKWVALALVLASLAGVVGSVDPWARSPHRSFMIWPSDGWLLLSAFALARRNRVARLASVWLAALFLGGDVMRLVLAHVLNLGGNWWSPIADPSSVSSTLGPLRMVVNGAWILALVALLHPAIRAAFGASPEEVPGEFLRSTQRLPWRDGFGRVLVVLGLATSAVWALCVVAVVDKPLTTAGQGLMLFFGFVGPAVGLVGTVLGGWGLVERLRTPSVPGLGRVFFSALCFPLLFLSTVLAVWGANSLTHGGGSARVLCNALALACSGLVFANLGLVTWAWRTVCRRVCPSLEPGQSVPEQGRVILWTVVVAVVALPLFSALLSPKAYLVAPAFGGNDALETLPELAAPTGVATPPVPSDSGAVPTFVPSVPAPSEVSSPVELAKSVMEAPKAAARIQLLRDQLADARARFTNGTLTTLEVRRIERDLQVAEAAEDPVAVALARREFSDDEVRAARQQVAVGVGDTLFLRSLETTNLLLSLDYVSACVGARSSPGTRTKSAMQLEEARNQVKALQEQAAVGQVAPEGREIVAARSELEIREAMAKADAPDLARVFRDASTRWLKLIEVLHGVGKATAEELAKARQEAERDERVFAALQSH